MPLTPSHLAVVLPFHSRLRQSPGLFEALIWGSMAPDLGHVIHPLGEHRDLAHSPWGILVFCLPVGLVAWLLWRLVLARPCVDLLPRQWRYNLMDYLQVPLEKHLWLKVPLGIVLGAWVHQLWDHLSHGWIPETWASQMTLQISFSIFGLGLIGLWLWRIRRQHPQSPSKERWTRLWGWIFLSFCTLIGLAYAVATWLQSHHFYLLTRFQAWVDLLWNCGRISIPTFHLGLVLYAGLWWYLYYQKVARAPRNTPEFRE
jgi:hypothetical protein